MISQHLLPIDRVISSLGYDLSENLIKRNAYKAATFSSQVKKVLEKINPYAAYMVNNIPFILFFDLSISEKKTLQAISKQIWNAQIPVAIFCDENTIRIFNGTALDLSDLTVRQIDTFSVESSSEDSFFSFRNVTDPQFWLNYSQEYSTEKLNYFLLDNISYLTKELKNRFQVPFATKLVLRLIFIRYLIDRGVDLDYHNFSSNIRESQDEFLRIIQSKDELYSLFSYLKEQFNGNLFELDHELDSGTLIDEVFELFESFFSEKEILFNGQRSLFSLYDFDIIPVELISSMYEILIGQEIRDKDNAFYTPNYLVEFILDSIVSKSLNEKSYFTILDPSCGSGVFLVDSYRRIIEKNLCSKPYCEDDDLLKNILINNIFGIDKNEEAIDITIFSLYLTILDYKDPKTLSNFRLPDLKCKNLFVGDFFDNEALAPLFQKKVKFDFIIGNPPWGNVKDGLHMSYCKENNYMDRQMNNEISRSFVFRSKDFSNSDTICCFILHAKLLYNKKTPSVSFRKFLLTDTKIKTIVELSSVRKLLFENATAPAVIIAFQFCNHNNPENHFTHMTIKPNIFFELFHVFVIEKNDVKQIPQSLLLNNDWAWKTIAFGTSFDIDIISKLRREYQTLGKASIAQNPAIIMGAGVEYQDGDQNDSTHLIGKRLLNSYNGVDHFIINAIATEPFCKAKVHRPRDQRLFEPPHVFVPKGIDCENYKLKAAYSEDYLVAKTTMYIFKGEPSQKNFLLDIVGLLNSSLYAYLNLMLGSSVGVEREQRFMDEVLSFPFVFSDAIVEKVDYIQNYMHKHSQAFSAQNEDITIAMNELDNLILREVGLENNIFIDYALNIQIPDLTGVNRSKIYRIVTPDDLIKYSKCFEKQFSRIFKQYGKHIALIVHPNVGKRYAAFELQVKEQAPTHIVTVLDSTSKDTVLLSKLAVHAYNDKFLQIRDVIHFTNDSFFIIKPNIYKYWHPAIAEIDLADVVDQIMTATGGEE